MRMIVCALLAVLSLVSICANARTQAINAPANAPPPIASATPWEYRAPAAPQLGVPASCPTTKPPRPPFVPPLPWSAEPSAGGRAFWYGTSHLWTELRSDGTWRLREFSPSDPTFRQKSPWWREGYSTPHGPEPDLTVTGERVDAPAPPLRPLQANSTWEPSKPDQSFMMTGFNLPTLGCWRITGHYQDVRVTYVVWVTR
jgi:hypothetical protein